MVIQFIHSPISPLRHGSIANLLLRIVEINKELVDESDKISSLTNLCSGNHLCPIRLKCLLGEGCFIANDRLDFILQSLRQKKNLILQGPPGTGKSWLAKRMGYALIGAKDESKLRAVQFHPNLSYEDFVRGYRPNGQGKLELVEGLSWR